MSEQPPQSRPSTPVPASEPPGRMLKLIGGMLGPYLFIQILLGGLLDFSLVVIAAGAGVLAYLNWASSDPFDAFLAEATAEQLAD